MRPLSLLIIGVLPLLCVRVGAQPVDPDAAGLRVGRSEDESTRTAGERSVKGERVCLPAIPDEDGRIRLDCAIGLRGDDDNFYGLRPADPSKPRALPIMNERVLVIGYFIPGSDGSYGIAGDIVYTSIQPIDEPKVIVGTLLCIEHGEPDAIPSGRCRAVIETDGGRFWGLETSVSDTLADVSALTPGMRVKVEGTIVRKMPEHWHPWASMWAPRRIEGVLEVMRIGALQ